ncbi:C2HC5 finger protein [Pseudomassariella vexata]|uniref:C2HC5 finger protein n=1 Tax=Pseudomassariella vexata TaxID=1141098 RepID=A0A1Y2EFR6_9PEZI|nr:C2HC5 finger protein [Pseudomassariella vexata]ORY70409.1 C2HC5 finger protein [Pseudomassariella vexata]
MSISQLSRLLPLPEDELKQVLDYAATLSKTEAVDHFGNLLGDSPGAVDFISSFNSRRQDPKSASSQATASTARQNSSPDAFPKPPRGAKKKKAQLHTLAPRQITNLGPAPGTAYNKKDSNDEFLARRPSPASTSSGSVSPAKAPPKSATPPPKVTRTAAGHLISDLPKPKTKSNPASQSSNPGPKTKINISGGTAMHGASTALSDLDAAIRALEMTTNPSKTNDDETRRCNCVAARHPLLAAAPNCLSCGKVICVKEGLGPCTFCGTPVLSTSEVQSMIQELKAERGREKMAADRQANKRPDVSRTPAPFTKPRENTDEPNSAEAKALEHRDRLLAFQSQNARRTTVRDEAADFDVAGAMAGTGGSMWSTPEERARELKRQQKIMREMEWNAKPEYEKMQQVVSIDLVGGKVVRKMAARQRPQSPDEQLDTAAPVLAETRGNRGSAGGRNVGGGSGGAFSQNPLLGGLIKPVFETKGKGTGLEGRKDRKTRWRKVQDDLENNEDVILDGGAYGRRGVEDQTVVANADEPGCG